MKLNEVVKALDRHNNGSAFNFVYSKELPLNAKSKKAGVVAFKITKVPVRKGIRYSSQKEVLRKVEEEGKVLTHELPWGNWKDGYDNIIEYKGKDYVRLYIMGVPKTKYFIDGEEKSYDELKESGFLVNSFFSKRGSSPDALTVCVDSINDIF